MFTKWIKTTAALAALVLSTATQAQATPWTSLSLVSDTGSTATFDVRLNGLEACTANGDPFCDAVTALDFSIAASGSDIIISNLGATVTYAASLFASGGFLSISYWSNPGPDGAPAGAGPGNSVGAILASVGGTITSTTATSTGRTWASGGFLSVDISGFADLPASLAGTYSGFEGDGNFGGTLVAGYSVGLGQFIVNYSSVPEPGKVVLLGLGMVGLALTRRRTAFRHTSLFAALAASLGAVSVLILATTAEAVPIFFGPTPYLSTADIPAGFYAGGTPLGLEDFEDGSLDFGLTSNAGLGVVGPGGATDSVDADDGAIDGSGTLGHNLSSNTAITITFPSPVTAAAMVWTDGQINDNVTFEAFGPGLVSLGTITAVLGGVGFAGETAEDRFFGVQDTNGIIAIRLSNQGGPIDLDHVQFGNAVPEPSTALFLGLGLMGLARGRRSP